MLKNIILYIIIRIVIRDILYGTDERIKTMKIQTINSNFNNIQDKGGFSISDKKLNSTTRYKVLSVYEKQPDIHSLKVVDDMGKVWLGVCSTLSMEELICDLKEKNANNLKLYPWIDFSNKYFNREILEKDLFGNPHQLEEIYYFAPTNVILNDLEVSYQDDLLENDGNLSRNEFLDSLECVDLTVSDDNFIATTNPNYELWVVYNSGLTTAYEPINYTDELSGIDDNNQNIFNRYYWQLATAGANVADDFLNVWF